MDATREEPTLSELLLQAALDHPDRDALVLPDERRTYAGLLAGAERVHRGLTELGVRPGDHVGLLMANSTELAEALFGISLLGAVAVPLNVRLRRELGFVIAQAELVAVLTSDVVADYVDFTEVLNDVLPSLKRQHGSGELSLAEAPSLRRVILLRGAARPGCLGEREFRSLAAGAGPLPAASQGPGDAAAIIFTSGTTADPKGCVLSHRALIQRPRWRLGERLGGDVEPPRVWSAGPLFHIAALQLLIGSVATAGRYVTDYHFHPGRALAALEEHGITTAWPWFPPVMEGIIDHPEFDPASLSRLRSLGMIGPPELLRRVQELIPHAELLTSCGMTETGGTYALSAPTDRPELRAVTMGVPEPGIEIRIVDVETATELAAEEIGEILVRGDSVMDRYYKVDGGLDPEGWIHTGDLYLRTASGHLVFKGRIKDMLKVGGENVAAVEVESLLCEHPAVKVAEVVGAPDARLDEVPVAFVELDAGAAVTAEELIEHCRGDVASFKVPRAIHLLDATAWPMSATKVDKRVLRRWVAGEAEMPAPSR